jgi:hypothetical protein
MSLRDSKPIVFSNSKPGLWVEGRYYGIRTAHARARAQELANLYNRDVELIEVSVLHGRVAKQTYCPNFPRSQPPCINYSTEAPASSS